MNDTSPGLTKERFLSMSVDTFFSVERGAEHDVSSRMMKRITNGCNRILTDQSTVRNLVTCSRAEVSEWKGISATSTGNIQKILQSVGLSLRV